MNTRAIVLSLLLVFCSIAISAQSIYQKGSIQVGKKKFIDAYIAIDFRYPQRFQNSLTYISPKDYAKFQEKGKLKNSWKEKLSLKDFKGFTLENGQTFKVVKYADLTKKNLGMLPKRFCLEQIANGPIIAYKFYQRTTGKISHELANVVFESKKNNDKLLIDYIQDNFQILVQKESKNPRNIMAINLLNFIGDNEQVRANYEANNYGFRNQFTERQKFGVIVNQKYEAAFLRMINDYNKQQETATGN